MMNHVSFRGLVCIILTSMSALGVPQQRGLMVLAKEGKDQPLGPTAPPPSLTVVPPQAPFSPTPFDVWSRGPCKDPDYFPIAVWLQAPKNARQYQEAGINLYIGLWKGPTEQQLADLKKAGMPVICDQNELVFGHLWYVAQGVSRLRQWTGDRKIVWNCIECTRISHPHAKPTPHQVRAEVWMSIIHGRFQDHFGGYDVHLYKMAGP